MLAAELLLDRLSRLATSISFSTACASMYSVVASCFLLAISFTDLKMNFSRFTSLPLRVGVINFNRHLSVSTQTANSKKSAGQERSVSQSLLPSCRSCSSSQCQCQLSKNFDTGGSAQFACAV